MTVAAFAAVGCGTGMLAIGAAVCVSASISCLLRGISSFRRIAGDFCIVIVV